MKSPNFPEQVEQVTAWFKDWSECEQTVALYWLLKKSSPVRAKFLDQVLQQNLADCTEVKQLEAKANNEDFVLSLQKEQKDYAIRELLQLLPLLQVGKSEAKNAYLLLIDDLLRHTMLCSANIEESKQLLSYSLIHPALVEEKGKFEKWLECLNERFTQNALQNSCDSAVTTANSNLNLGHIKSHTVSLGTSSHHSIAYMAPLSMSQEYVNAIANSASVVPPSSVPSHGHSLPSPIMGSGTHSLWQHQNDMQGHYASCDASAAICPPLSNGDTSGCYMPPPTNGHMALRPTNSYAEPFGASHGHTPLHSTLSAPPIFSSLQPSGSHSHAQVGSQKTHAPLRRTQGVPQPVLSDRTSISDWFKNGHGHTSTSQTHPILTTSSRSQLSEHTPLSPQSSGSSSGSGGSDYQQEDGPQPSRDSFLIEGSGMREVPLWLKSLRLHKYSHLFKQMTYEEMLSVTEEWLEIQNVTKGARHKIYISILKLRERQGHLKQLEKEIVEQEAPLKPVITEMKCMLGTPMKAFNPAAHSLLTGTSQTPTHQVSSPKSPSTDEVMEGDLPSQFCRLMGKVFSRLLVASCPDDECFQSYMQLIDKCLQHEAFSHHHRKLMLSWKQSVQRNWQPTPKFGDRSRRAFVTSTLSLGDTSARPSLRGSHLSVPLPGFASQSSVWSTGARRASGVHAPVERLGSLNTQYLNKPGLLEASGNKQPVARTQSAPIHNKHVSLSSQGCENSSDTEINARLDSLVYSMTEHALGSSDASDSTSPC